MARFSFLLIVFLFCVEFSYEVGDVHSICQQTKNPSFCRTLLNSKRGPKDLISLAQYTIRVVRAKTTETIKLIKQLIAQSGSNVNATEHYKTCLSYFGNEDDVNGVLTEIASVQQFLKTRDYQSVSVHASSIIADIGYCISGDSPSDPPYPDTSLLPKYADVVEEVAEIVLTISNFLIQEVI